MEKLSPLFERTCCRLFDDTKSVSKEELELIMEAGQTAPSAKHRQPYYFVAIINKDCREEIYRAAEDGRKKQFAHLSKQGFEDTAKGETGSNDKSIYDASAAILVFRDSDPKYKEAKEQSKNLNIKEEQGIACTALSMMLQAHHMGLNTGWICSPLYIKKELKEILTKYGVEFNDNWEPRLIIPLGYCKVKPRKPRRDELNQKSSFIE
jgi:nitroreductase